METHIDSTTSARFGVRPFVALLVSIACMIPMLNCDRRAAKTGTGIRVEHRGTALIVTTPAAEFQFSTSGSLKGSLLQGSLRSTLDDSQTSQDSSTVKIDGEWIADFAYDVSKASVTDVARDINGIVGKRIEISGKSSSRPALEKKVALEIYEDMPSVILTSITYKNAGSDLMIERTVDSARVLNAAESNPGASPYDMWSFHGSSEAWGKDDVMQITKNFERDNPMQVVQHNDENETGGGLPIVAFWTRSSGQAVGSAETVPLVLSIPVRTTEKDGKVRVSILREQHTLLPAGGTYTTPKSFLAVFRGDFYEPLSLYSKLLQHHGWSLAKQTKEDYEANWCGWGYGMDVTPQQMLGTIPKLKQFGFKWATLDVRWFNNRGDWQPRPDTFPGDSVQRIARAYHDAGIKITLWWIPAIVEDGHAIDILDHRPYKVSNVAKEHPDWLILDERGKPARATTGLAVLCPALPEVRQYTKQLTERFIRDWDFDGSKLDFSYTVPACYNPKHHHKSPTDSITALGDLYRIILETSRSLKPQSVTQACPCGTPPSLAWLPFIDQAVTGDPVGSRQVRERTKMYKALLGPQAAVYGDHVELTDMKFDPTLQDINLGQDFASEIGVGAVLGTKFTWPAYGPELSKLELTPEKEAHWKKWIDIYNSKMLSKGQFLNLYFYGYDFPEGYAIEKNGTMFYAFYVDKKQSWSGELELRGLKAAQYQIVDYEHGRVLGTVNGAHPKLKVAFQEHLLLEAKRQ